VDAGLRGSAVLTEVAERVATAALVLTGVAESDGAAVGAPDVTRVGELDGAGESVAAGVEAAAEPDGPQAAVGDAVVGLVADGVGAGQACSPAVQDGSVAGRVWFPVVPGGSLPGESGADRGGPRVDQVLLQAGRDGLAPCRGLGGRCRAARQWAEGLRPRQDGPC